MSVENVMVIDGGFASQLTQHVSNRVDGDPLWSARFNATSPNAITETHLDFLKAGADAILTNTYQASVEGYMQYLDLNKKGSIDLIKATVQLAHVARARFLNEVDRESSVIDIPWIVGSIGPYGAHLHDGSEYTGSYADYVTADSIKNWHRTRIAAVIEAGVDALAIETIPCKMEAEALLELLSDEYPNVKFWISFQCQDDEKLAHGENFSETVRKLWNKSKENENHKNLVAIGVNCLHPKNVSALFRSVNGSYPREYHIPLIVYPNSGEVYTVEDGWTGKEDCIPLENYVPEWLELGARVFGGCCRTYARDIHRIKQTVETICSSHKGLTNVIH